MTAGAGRSLLPWTALTVSNRPGSALAPLLSTTLGVPATNPPLSHILESKPSRFGKVAGLRLLPETNHTGVSINKPIRHHSDGFFRTQDTPATNVSVLATNAEPHSLIRRIVRESELE
jgi:hypothetical protein